MQPISYTCICISCNCRFMMFRKKIIKMPNLTLTIYPITCHSFNWIGQLVGLPSFGAALALFVVSRRTPLSGKCPRGKCPGGKCPFPGVLVWSTKLVDGRTRVLSLYNGRAHRGWMHAANHSRSLALSPFDFFSDTTSYPRFNKIVRRLIFYHLWDVASR